MVNFYVALQRYEEYIIYCVLHKLNGTGTTTQHTAGCDHPTLSPGSLPSVKEISQLVRLNPALS